MKSNIKIVIYARVSTKEQNVKQQLKLLRKYARDKGYKIQRCYVDKDTGLKMSRSAFKNLLIYGDDGKVENLLIYASNRLTRAFYDAIEIEKWIIRNNINVISISEPNFNMNSATDRMMFRIGMAIAAREVEDMKEKQAIGIDRAKKEGKYKGRKKGAKNKC